MEIKLPPFPVEQAEHAICDAYRRIAQHFASKGYDKKTIDQQLQKIIYEKNQKFSELFGVRSGQGD